MGTAQGPQICSNLQAQASRGHLGRWQGLEGWPSWREAERGGWEPMDQSCPVRSKTPSRRCLFRQMQIFNMMKTERREPAGKHG